MLTNNNLIFTGSSEKYGPWLLHRYQKRPRYMHDMTIEQFFHLIYEGDHPKEHGYRLPIIIDGMSYGSVIQVMPGETPESAAVRQFGRLDGITFKASNKGVEVFLISSGKTLGSMAAAMNIGASHNSGSFVGTKSPGYRGSASTLYTGDECPPLVPIGSGMPPLERIPPPTTPVGSKTMPPLIKIGSQIPTSSDVPPLVPIGNKALALPQKYMAPDSSLPPLVQIGVRDSGKDSTFPPLVQVGTKAPSASTSMPPLTMVGENVSTRWAAKDEVFAKAIMKAVVELHDQAEDLTGITPRFKFNDGKRHIVFAYTDKVISEEKGRELVGKLAAASKQGRDAYAKAIYSLIDSITMSMPDDWDPSMSIAQYFEKRCAKKSALKFSQDDSARRGPFILSHESGRTTIINPTGDKSISTSTHLVASPLKNVYLIGLDSFFI
jgi:hypothetical protein